MDYTDPVCEFRMLPYGQTEWVDIWQPYNPWLKAANLKLTYGQIPVTIQATLEAPYEDALKLMEGELLTLFSTVGIRFGYGREGLFTPWYYGLTTEPKVQLSPDGLSLTLVAQPAADMSRTEGMKIWSGMTPLKVVEEILNKYGFRIETDLAEDSALLKDLPQEKSQGGRSDWYFIKELCNHNGSQVWFGTGGQTGKPTLFVKSFERSINREPARTFRMFGTLDVRGNEYPLLDFSTPEDIRFNWLPRAAGGILSADVDPDTKEVKVTTADQNSSGSGQRAGRENELAGASTEQGVQTEVGIREHRGTPESFECGRLIGVTYRDILGKRKIQSEYDLAGRLQSGVRAILTVLGDPYTLIEDTVQVEGCSKRYNGPYTVQGVEHTYDSSGWVTKISVMSTGVPGHLEIGQKRTASNTPPATGGEKVQVSP